MNTTLAVAMKSGLLLVFASSSALPQAEIRLTEQEVMALPSIEAGAGTSGLAGIRTRILAGDPTAEGPYTIALYVPANTSIAAHRHSDTRSAVVISGMWHFGFGAEVSQSGLKALQPGSFYTEPAGLMHFAQTTTESALVYISGVGPTDTIYEVAGSTP